MRDPKLGIGLVIQLTVVVAVAGLAPLVLGIYLDQLAHTAPFITLIMLAFSMILGPIAVYREVNAVYNRIAGGKK